MKAVFLLPFSALVISTTTTAASHIIFGEKQIISFVGMTTRTMGFRQISSSRCIRSTQGILSKRDRPTMERIAAAASAVVATEMIEHGLSNGTNKALVGPTRGHNLTAMWSAVRQPKLRVAAFIALTLPEPAARFAINENFIPKPFDSGTRDWTTLFPHAQEYREIPGGASANIPRLL